MYNQRRAPSPGTKKTLQERFAISEGVIAVITLIFFIANRVGTSIFIRILQGRGMPASNAKEAVVKKFYETGNNMQMYMAYYLLLLVGAIALPLLFYLFINAYRAAENKLRLFVELLAFAVVCEIPYDLATFGKPFDFTQQNIFFLMAFAVFVLWGWDYLQSREMSGVLKVILQILDMLAGCVVIFFLRPEYGIACLLIIVIMYTLRARKTFSALAGGLILSFFQQEFMVSLFAAIPIYLHNGKRGFNWKYMFAIIIVLHPLILFGIYHLFFA